MPRTAILPDTSRLERLRGIWGIFQEDRACYKIGKLVALKLRREDRKRDRKNLRVKIKIY